MYHGKCTSKFEFFWKMAEGVYIIYMLDTSFLFEQDTIHGPTAQSFMQFMFQQSFCCYDIE